MTVYFFSTAYRPEIKSKFTEVKVAAEKDALLPCHIDGKPTPTIYWKREGLKMEGSRYIMDPKGNLTIKVKNSIGKKNHLVLLRFIACLHSPSLYKKNSFYAPASIDGRLFVFYLSVCLSVCPFVCQQKLLH